jgi:tetratricopeptide (TPR) repeat protein
MANQATLYSAIGDQAAAENMLRDALAVLKRSPNVSPVQVAEAESRLAEVFLVEGNHKEAEQRIERALPVLKTADETIETANALNNLGLVRRWQHRYAESLDLVSTAVAMTKQKYGADHPLVLRPLNNVAVLYYLMGHNEEADATFEQARKLCLKALPPGHPSYASLLNNYAAFLRKTGEKSRAKTMEAQARSMNRDNRSRDGLGLTVDVSSFRHP